MFAAVSKPEECLSVIDPCNRTGKIEIPVSFVTETKGVTDFKNFAGNPPPDAKDLSLCLLFQKGRCNAGARCNQVHAAPEFVDQLRVRARAARTCCAAHGDANSTGLDEARPVVVHAEDGVRHFRLGDFARTPSLEVAISRARTATVRVQASRICRLHGRGSCKFGRDCKNIHLCPSAQPTTAPPARMEAAPRPVTVEAPPAPPALGLAFRAVDINDRCTAPPAHGPRTRGGCDATAVDVSAASAFAPSCSANTSGSDFAALDGGASRGASVHPMSVLNLMGEFNSMRGQEVDAASDPLDLVDADASSSASSGADFAHDFGAFMDALVQCADAEPMASPQWLVAPAL